MKMKNGWTCVLAGAGLLIAALVLCVAPALGQAAPPSAAQLKPADPAETFWQGLNPYQKSQIERMYTDWGDLAKYRDADAALPAPASGEGRVVFMGDSITEGWGMKATATSPARGETRTAAAGPAAGAAAR